MKDGVSRNKIVIRNLPLPFAVRRCCVVSFAVTFRRLSVATCCRGNLSTFFARNFEKIPWQSRAVAVLSFVVFFGGRGLLVPPPHIFLAVPPLPSFRENTEYFRGNPVVAVFVVVVYYSIDCHTLTGSQD